MREKEPLPYLPFLGAPPLRFQDATPPPDLASRPAAAAPPQPHLTPAESSVGLANSAAASLASARPKIEARASDPHEPAQETPRTDAVPILPDTVRTQVQAEDFLPFFLIPGPAKTVGTAPSAPEPGTLPPSSATYTETPR